MALIEGIGDEVTVFFSIVLVFALLVIAWLSTYVQDRPINVIVLNRQAFEALLQRILNAAIYPNNNNNRTAQTAITADTTSNADTSTQQEGGTSSDANIAREINLDDPSTDHVIIADYREPVAAGPAPVENTPQNDVEQDNSVHSTEAAGNNEELRYDALDTQSTNTECDEVPQSETELRNRRVAFFQNQGKAEGSAEKQIAENTTHAEPQSSHSEETTREEKQTGGTTVNSTQGASNLGDSQSNTSQTEQTPAPSSTPETGSSGVDPTPSGRIDDVGAGIFSTEELPDGHIRIRLKYLDERQRWVSADPNATIGQFKRQHFASEIAENYAVRFIYNGQELQRDGMSLQSYNVTNESVIHCLLSRVNVATEMPGQSGAGGREEFDIGNLMVPMFALVLALLWYFRFNYRNYFNATSTFTLVGITFFFVVALLASWRTNEVHEEIPQQE